MPEGHTLHRLAGELNHSFAGHRVRVSSPQGRFAASAAELDDTTMIIASAHGKQLFCDFDDDRILHIHLGLIGALAPGSTDTGTWGGARPVGHIVCRGGSPWTSALRGANP